MFKTYVFILNYKITSLHRNGDTLTLLFIFYTHLTLIYIIILLI